MIWLNRYLMLLKLKTLLTKNTVSSRKIATVLKKMCHSHVIKIKIKYLIWFFIDHLTFLVVTLLCLWPWADAQYRCATGSSCATIQSQLSHCLQYEYRVQWWQSSRKHSACFWLAKFKSIVTAQCTFQCVYDNDSSHANSIRWWYE